MKVYALTPTGGRPEALALLGEYLNAQTYRGELTWVIVDDCEPMSRIPTVRDGINVIVVIPEWTWRPGMNTQADCMRRGLLEVPKDAVLFVLEDDDIYLPEYIETMLAGISGCELIGEKTARYFNVASNRHRVIEGSFHSSMASTVCLGAALEWLREICESGTKKLLDFKLWREYPGRRKLLPTKNVVGVKGLPGRPGIGVGHKKSFGRVAGKDLFRRWVGDYADNYEIFGVQS